jgi:hypothetical protein
MSLKLTFQASVDEFGDAFKQLERPIAEAATAAVREVAQLAKTKARASIAAGGFGPKWQNALRAEVYPQGGASISAAAWIYHKIPYASVFEEGATIRGNPKLWLPLTGTPKSIGGRRATPQAITSRFGQILFPIRSRGGVELLAAKVQGPAAGGQVTTAMLSGAVRRGQRRGRRSGAAPLQTVPLFHAVSAVTIRKRFDIEGACADAASRLEALYFKNFRAD